MRKYLRLITLVVPLSIVTLFGFNNCGRYGELNGNDDLSSSSRGNPRVVEDLDSEKLGLPVALLSAEQTLASMLKLTNTETPSTAIVNEYNGRYSSLAAGNSLTMVNPPLILASTSLAGEVCNNLLAQERGQNATARSFFGSINFAAGVNAMTEAEFSATIRGLARQFWGRSETTEEMGFLQDFRTEFTNALGANARNEAASSNNLMMATCAAMLSSMDAISY